MSPDCYSTVLAYAPAEKGPCYIITSTNKVGEVVFSVPFVCVSAG